MTEFYALKFKDLINVGEKGDINQKINIEIAFQLKRIADKLDETE